MQYENISGRDCIKVELPRANQIVFLKKELTSGESRKIIEPMLKNIEIDSLTGETKDIVKNKIVKLNVLDAINQQNNKIVVMIQKILKGTQEISPSIDWLDNLYNEDVDILNNAVKEIEQENENLKKK